MLDETFLYAWGLSYKMMDSMSSQQIDTFAIGMVIGIVAQAREDGHTISEQQKSELLSYAHALREATRN